MTLDANNNIYVVDTISGLIHKIRLEGIVARLSGSMAGFNDAIGSAAQFKFVYATNPSSILSILRIVEPVYVRS